MNKEVFLSYHIVCENCENAITFIKKSENTETSKNYELRVPSIICKKCNNKMFCMAIFYDEYKAEPFKVNNKNVCLIESVFNGTTIEVSDLESCDKKAINLDKVTKIAVNFDSNIKEVSYYIIFYGEFIKTTKKDYLRVFNYFEEKANKIKREI